jgi:hypothetical protein
VAASNRRVAAVLVAVAAHVERNTPQVFPPATTDRLEDAADELLGAASPLSFETRTVLARILQSLVVNSPPRPWAAALRDHLSEYLAENP